MRRLGSVLSALALALSACSSGDARHDSGSRPEPTVVPSPGFVNGGDCYESQEPEFSDAGCLTSVSADADGDGWVDTLSVYARIDRDLRPRSWRIRLESGSQDIDQKLRAGNAFSYPRALGAADVNDDGRAEFFIKVSDYTSHGAPWSRVDMYVLSGGRLSPITFQGEPLAVNYGGIARLGEGARCRSENLVLLRAEAIDRKNTRWRYSERTFAIDGGRARMTKRESGTLRISDYNDPALDPFYRIECNGFSYPS